MERARGILELTPVEAMKVDPVKVNPHIPHKEMSFYEDLAVRGVRIRRVEPGLIVCALKVPPRLIARDGKLAAGAIVGFVDEIGASLTYIEGHSMSVSVNISVSYIGDAKVDDELEVTAKLMGKKGNIVDTHVIIGTLERSLLKADTSCFVNTQANFEVDSIAIDR
ncbi:LOW QUALITY PROTEIN: hypothetical protein V2J09_009235 [Rumex salicifolius]